MEESQYLAHSREFLRRLWKALKTGFQRYFPETYAHLPDYWRLTRMDRPIGIFLLLWPTLWCLWIAAGGFPDFDLLLIFVLGTILMRAAGCCINDFADRDFDGHVERTKDRPLAAGRISSREALTLCALLCLLAFSLVLLTNRLTIYMSFGGLAIALVYPFMKRFTHLAQLVLGAAFSWGGLMAFTAQTGALPVYAWLLYTANFLWTVVYDTQYAMVDREDDLKIGVKSTAILFAEADRFVIGALQVMFLVAMSLSAEPFGLGGWFQFGLFLAACLFAYQQYLTWKRHPKDCFRAFLNNHRVGMVIFFFTMVDLFVP